MRNLARQTDFAFEVLERLRIAGQRFLHHLDHDVFFQPLVARAEYLAHAALAEIGDQTETPEDGNARLELGVRDGRVLLRPAADVGEGNARRDLCGRKRLSQELLQLRHQDFGVDRLGQEVGRAKEQSLVHGEGIIARGKKDERNVAPFPPERVQQREAVHSCQDRLADNQRRWLTADNLQRRAAIGSGIGAITFIGQAQGEEVPRAGIAVDDENAAASCGIGFLRGGLDDRLDSDWMQVA